MAFNLNTLAPLDTGANSDCGRVWLYKTSDNAATVEGATYFDASPPADRWQTGDVLLAIMGDATKLYKLTVSGTNVTLSAGLAIT